MGYPAKSVSNRCVWMLGRYIPCKTAAEYILRIGKRFNLGGSFVIRSQSFLITRIYLMLPVLYKRKHSLLYHL